ncbi:MAG TPA: hypothetical protein PK760_04140, partial [Flavobacteriales bacterium]|nr:hypothetical protein [Flavobacteriales bacterium]
MRRRLPLFVAMLLSCLFSQAQEPLRPEVKQEMWLATALQSRLPKFTAGLLGDAYKRIRVRNELGYRSADVFFAGKQYYLDVNVRYKLGDIVSVAYEHRFAKRTEQYGLRHRSILQVQATKEFGRLEADYRFIYQHSYIEWGGQ